MNFSNINKILVMSAAAIFLIYFAVGLIDFGMALLQRWRCPIEADIASLPDEYFSVYQQAISHDAKEVAAAAEKIYEDRLVSDAETTLGFRDLCFAKKIRRRAAVLGDEASKDWLVSLYRQVNFPMAGNEQITSPCLAQEWSKWNVGNPVPGDVTSLTRHAYFWRNSCKYSYFWIGSNERMLKSAVLCNLDAS